MDTSRKTRIILIIISSLLIFLFGCGDDSVKSSMPFSEAVLFGNDTPFSPKRGYEFSPASEKLSSEVKFASTFAGRRLARYSEYNEDSYPDLARQFHGDQQYRKKFDEFYQKISSVNELAPEVFSVKAPAFEYDVSLQNVSDVISAAEFYGYYMNSSGNIEDALDITNVLVNLSAACFQGAPNGYLRYDWALKGAETADKACFLMKAIINRNELESRNLERMKFLASFISVKIPAPDFAISEERSYRNEYAMNLLKNYPDEKASIEQALSDTSWEKELVLELKKAAAYSGIIISRLNATAQDDPFTAKTLLRRRKGMIGVIYSAGPDMEDNMGEGDDIGIEFTIK